MNKINNYDGTAIRANTILIMLAISKNNREDIV